MVAHNRIFAFSVLFFITVVFDAQGQILQNLSPQEQAYVTVLHRQILDHDVKGLRQNLQQSQYQIHINAVDHDSYSLLQNAVRKNDLEIVEVLLDAGANVNFQSSVNHYNAALHYSRYPAITQKLIDYGAKPNLLNDKGSSPLLVHIRKGRGLTAENIHILLEAGARTDIVSHTKKLTALHLLFKISPEYRYEMNLLPPSQKKWFGEIRLQIARDLIAHDIDINAPSIDGFTALHYAARIGNIEAIRLLVHSGAEIDAVDINYQYTPMMYALGARAMDAVEALLSLGGRFDIPDYKGHSVEYILRRYGKDDSRFPRLIGMIDQMKGTFPTCVKPLIRKSKREPSNYSL